MRFLSALSPIKYLFGYDLFISYSRSDGSVYAGALAAALNTKGFSVFIDQSGTTAGKEVPKGVLRVAGRSSAGALVTSIAACTSPHVYQEARELSRHNTPILPIVFIGDAEEEASSALAQSALRDFVTGLAISAEPFQNLKSGTVSDSTLRRVELAVGTNRQRRRLKRATIGSAALLLTLILSSLAVALQLKFSLVKLDAMQVQLKESQEKLDVQQTELKTRSEELDLAGGRLARSKEEARKWTSLAQQEARRVRAQRATTGRIWQVLDPLIGDLSSTGRWECIDGELSDASARIVISPSWEHLSRAPHWSPVSKSILTIVSKSYLRCYPDLVNAPALHVAGNFGLRVIDANAAICSDCTPFDLIRGSTPEYSVKVSLKYAHWVAEELRREGIPTDKLVISGYGEEKPTYLPHAGVTSIDVSDERDRKEFLNNNVEINAIRHVRTQ